MKKLIAILLSLIMICSTTAVVDAEENGVEPLPCYDLNNYLGTWEYVYEVLLETAKVELIGDNIVSCRLDLNTHVEGRSTVIYTFTGVFDPNIGRILFSEYTTLDFQGNVIGVYPNTGNDYLTVTEGGRLYYGNDRDCCRRFSKTSGASPILYPNTGWKKTYIDFINSNINSPNFAYIWIKDVNQDGIPELFTSSKANSREYMYSYCNGSLAAFTPSTIAGEEGVLALTDLKIYYNSSEYANQVRYFVYTSANKAGVARIQDNGTFYYSLYEDKTTSQKYNSTKVVDEKTYKRSLNDSVQLYNNKINSAFKITSVRFWPEYVFDPATQVKEASTLINTFIIK